MPSLRLLSRWVLAPSAVVLAFAGWNHPANATSPSQCIAEPGDDYTFNFIDAPAYDSADVSFTPGAFAPTTWTATGVYETSGGKGLTTWYSVSNYATSGYGFVLAAVSEGGMVTYTGAVGASGIPTNPGSCTGSGTIYVAGVSIPPATVTALLASLYTNGATPTLLEQLATYESDYGSFGQFRNASNFGVTALWPTESYDGGSHIGLMQVAVTLGVSMAFNYTLNANEGASEFKMWLRLATTHLMKVYHAHKGLPMPTGLMFENEALTNYNMGTRAEYYIVTRSANGTPQWTKNSASVTQYADCLRTQVVPNRHSC